MKNFVQAGDSITVAAAADVLSGAGHLVGSIFGVATNDALSGADVVLVMRGVFTLPKTSALAISVGDKLYWDNTAKELNTTPTANTLVGVAVTAAANPSATVNVRLDGAVR